MTRITMLALTLVAFASSTALAAPPCVMAPLGYDVEIHASGVEVVEILMALSCATSHTVKFPYGPKSKVTISVDTGGPVAQSKSWVYVAAALEPVSYTFTKTTDGFEAFPKAGTSIPAIAPGFKGKPLEAWLDHGAKVLHLETPGAPKGAGPTPVNSGSGGYGGATGQSPGGAPLVTGPGGPKIVIPLGPGGKAKPQGGGASNGVAPGGGYYQVTFLQSINAGMTTTYQYELADPLRDMLLAETSPLTKEATATPLMIQGTLQGIKITGIKPGSAWSSLGFVDGDLIIGLDGASLKKTAVMLNKLEGMRKHDHFFVTVSRAGAQVTLEYFIK